MDERSRRRLLAYAAGLCGAAVSVAGGAVVARDDGSSGTVSRARTPTAAVVTGPATPDHRGVVLHGRMASFGAYHFVRAGFEVSGGGATESAVVKLWNPAVTTRETPVGGEEYGPAVVIHVRDAQVQEFPQSVDQWRLEPGMTYTYRAVADLPREGEPRRLRGDRRRFTMPN